MTMSLVPERPIRSANSSNSPLRQPTLDWQKYVEIDPRYFRPAEVDYLCADTSKAQKALDWEPTVTFEELVRIMVEADIKELATRLKGGAEALQLAASAEGKHS